MGFYACLRGVLQYEGGYANNSADRGGETYKGISRRFHPNWAGWEIVDDVKERHGGIEALRSGDVSGVVGAKENEMLERLVALFYRGEFLDELKANKIAKHSQRIACALFDTAVNMGKKRAARMLQRAINEVRGDAAVKADGIIGKKTLKAIADLNSKQIEALMDAFKKERVLRYAKIVQKDPSQAVFLVGWLKRALMA